MGDSEPSTTSPDSEPSTSSPDSEPSTSPDMETSTVVSDTETSTDSQETETTTLAEEGSTSIIEDAVVTLVTTLRSTQEDNTDTTEQPDEEDADDEEEDEGMHEFDCTEMSSGASGFASPDQIPLECRLRTEGKPKTVFIVINREGIDTDRLFNKNVKVVVKDLMVMDISPKKK